jgi:hypothetical protein
MLRSITSRCPAALNRAFRKLAVAGALAVATVGVGAAGTPASASAAATTYTSFCFKHSNGAVWGRKPAYAQKYINGLWYDIGSTTTNIYGCDAFYMPANSYVRVRAYLRLANTVYMGATTWITTPPYGGGSYSLGTGIIGITSW